MKSFSFIHAADLHLDVVLPLRGASGGAPGALEAADSGPAHVLSRGLDRELSRELDRELNGGGQLERTMLGLARDASFMAWQNLVSLCLDEQVDFLLLAGDLYHQEDGSLKAYFALRDGFETLRKAGIQVFIAHGNHDPLPSSATDRGDRAGLMPWPDNVRVFGRDVERLPVGGSGERREEIGGDKQGDNRGDKLALVHGVSHAGPAETQNLAKDFRRVEATLLEPEVFQIGLLHCCIGKADGHKAYAPCVLNDLCAAQLDYWALGHIHARREVCKRPQVHYPGSLQGLHVNETGRHGCLLVRVDEKGHARTSFRAVAPLQWEVLRLDLSGPQIENFADSANERSRAADLAPDSPTDRTGSDRTGSGRAGSKDAVVEDIRQGVSHPDGPGREASLESAPELGLDDLEGLLVEKMHESAEESKGPLCRAVIFRLVLEGRSSLDPLLRKPGASEELCARIRAALQDSRSAARQGQPLLWLKDLRIATRPERDLENLRNSEGFLGELLRYSSELGRQGADCEARNAEAMPGHAAEPFTEPFTEPGAEPCMEPGTEPWAESLAVLYEVKRNKKYLPDPPGPETLLRLVREAEEVCLDKLGVD